MQATHMASARFRAASSSNTAPARGAGQYVPPLPGFGRRGVSQAGAAGEAACRGVG
eukprot:SAG22_NODE_2281_length_2760_cov_21.201052_5_plen_55_part_01